MYGINIFSNILCKLKVEYSEILSLILSSFLLYFFYFFYFYNVGSNITQFGEQLSSFASFFFFELTVG